MNHINIFENHFKAVFPELFLAIAATVLLLYGAIYNPSAYYKFPILTKNIGWLSLQTLLITVLLLANGWSSSNSLVLKQQPHSLLDPLGSAASLGFGPNIEESTFLIFGGALIVDDFTTVIKIILLLSAFSSILLSLSYIQSQKIDSYEYVVLTMFSTLSMLLIASSYDLISMYLAIELQSLSFYVLAAFQRNNEFSTEAGLKYFVLGALSSGLLLFGESIIYGFTGITNFEELTKFCLLWVPPVVPTTTLLQLDGSPGATTGMGEITSWVVPIGLLFMLVAFLFKISAVPFHMWTPDVYEGAPTSVTAFFAITPKIALLALLSRLLMDTFYDLIDSWGFIIAVCSLLSMYIGTFGALNQNKIKRLFAYSSIAHVGYLLLGLATGTIEAVESLLIYVIIYILMIINVFGIVLTLSKNYSWVATSAPRAFVSPTQPPAVGFRSFASRPTTYKWLGTSSDPVAGAARDTEHFAALLRAALPTWNSFALVVQPKGLGTHEQSEVSQMALAHPRGAAQPVPSGSKPFGLTMGVSNWTRIKKKDEYIKYITDLSMLSKTNPILAASAAIIFFSNAGVPPLAGFYGKLNVFLAAVSASMYLLAIAGILCSVLGAFYSIRLVKIIYFHSMAPSKQRHWTPYRQMSKENSILLALTFYFTIFFFSSPSFLYTITHSAALSLCL